MLGVVRKNFVAEILQFLFSFAFCRATNKNTLRTGITFFFKVLHFLTCAVLILTKQKRKGRKREKPSHKLDSNYKLLNCTNYKIKQYNRFLNIGSPVKFK